MKIAVIGAGIAGVTLARELDAVAELTVFEKSRGFGGRMAVRRREWQFDHGAQYFTARAPEFKSLLEPLIEQGLVADWQPRVLTFQPGSKPFKRERFEPQYVAIPGMNALAKHLAEGLDIKLQTRIGSVVEQADGWQLIDEEGVDQGQFDWVVFAAPAPQTLALLPAAFVQHAAIEAVELSPCITLMLGYTQAPKLNFDGALIRESILAWVAVNSGKPGRTGGPALVVQSANDWAEKHLDSPIEEVQQQLLAALTEMFGDEVSAPDHIDTHRWRFARTEKALAVDFLLQAETRLAVCGDWCRGNRVEDGFLSGLNLARALRARL